MIDVTFVTPAPLPRMTHQIHARRSRDAESCEPRWLPEPHGITMTCAAYNAFRAAGRRLLDSMLEEIAAHLCKLEGVG